MHTPGYQKKSIITSYGKIYYFTTNKLFSRPTVVLLHGLSANHSTWDKTVKALHAKKINCLAPDLRGHGFSDKTKRPSLYSVKQQASDLKQILEKEQINNCILVGYSYGGIVALESVVNFSDKIKGLILIGTNHRSPAYYKGIGWLNRPLIALYYLASFIMLWQSKKTYDYYKPNLAKNYWQATWQGLKTMPASVNGWLLAKLLEVDYRKQLSKINQPVTIVYSKNDPFLSKQEVADMLEKLPNGDSICSKNNNHFIATESNEELTEIIINFIDHYENRDF